jgi:uncharacterized protein YhbP (UPF0306 family)
MATTSTVPSSIPTEVLDYLRLHHIITLGTSSFTGMPHANTVAYANDANEIYFVTAPGTQVVRNMSDNRYVSFTIDDYTTDWRKVRELQGVGRCRTLTDAERPSGLAQFARKFGPYVAIPQGLVFAVRPLEVHFVDYTYEAVAHSGGVEEPQVTTRLYQIDDGPTPNSGAISTDLDNKRFAAGEMIFRPGDAPGHYYVVIDGEVEVRGEGYGADQTVTRVRVGQMFGDQATLRGQRGALTAHAVTAVTLLELQREAMRDMLLAAPPPPVRP